MVVTGHPYFIAGRSDGESLRFPPSKPASSVCGRDGYWRQVYSWGGDRFTLYTEVSGDKPVTDFDEGYSLKGVAGLRMRF